MPLYIYPHLHPIPFSSSVFCQSGSAIAWWSFVSDLEEERAQAFSLGEKVNCEAEDTVQLIDCLRSVDAARLYLAYSLVSERRFIH